MALDLTDTQRYALRGIVDMPGYQVLLDIAEKQCQIRETELLRLGPDTSSDTVLRKHAEARAGRIQFEQLQTEVSYQVGELSHG